MEEKPLDAVTKKDRFLPISIVVAAVLIAGSVLFATLYHPAAAPTAPAGGTAPVATTTAQAPSAAALAALQLTPRDAVLGSANAPVTVIEYGDYQCPFCTRYFSQVQPLIVQQYVDTGKAKLVFRDFPFLDQAVVAAGGTGESHAAAAAAYCAEDENQFWPYHDALYAAKVGDEAKGGGENDKFYTTALFLQIANQLGLNATTFANCVNSGKYASTTTADYTAAQVVGVDSTPTTFVNGQMVVDVNGNSVGADGTSVLQAIATASQ